MSSTGKLTTYFLKSKLDAERDQEGENSSSFGAEDYLAEEIEVVLSDRIQRLVDWNTDLLVRLLKEIHARRKAKGTVAAPESRLSDVERQSSNTNETPIAEVREIITLPEFKKEYKLVGADEAVISGEVRAQVHRLLTTIASMYHENPFHNFEHASHVTMSVVKLFSRIVAPDLDQVDAKALAETMHDHTYGITSDPLTQFAVILSALIHDVDHPGVPNSQLINEHSDLAKVYKEKSIAEQNSVDLAWKLLMLPEYRELRRAIYVTEKDFRRFRQLLVNTVLATDIMDKDLKNFRNNRWEKAFSGDSSEESGRDHLNRKATIVIEHLIQASDIAHTMQHWHIYRVSSTSGRRHDLCRTQSLTIRLALDSVGSHRNGIAGCLRNCTRRILKADLRKIRPTFGTRERLAFSTFTFSPLRRS